MANIKSAKKQAKQSLYRRKVNIARSSDIKTAIKKVVTALELGQDVAQAQEFMRVAESKIARAKGKGAFHANTAARKISGLAKRVAALAAK